MTLPTILVLELQPRGQVCVVGLRIDSVRKCPSQLSRKFSENSSFRTFRKHEEYDQQKLAGRESFRNCAFVPGSDAEGTKFAAARIGSNDRPIGVNYPFAA